MTASQRTITHRLGLIGAHLESSFSPALHEQEAAELGLNCTYERIDIEELGMAPERVGELVRATKALGFRGVSITHPCRQLVVAHLDGEFTVKRLSQRDGALYLVPENPLYQPIQITDTTDFSVWGVVTYCIHKVV